jgi:hypothetical protein
METTEVSNCCHAELVEDYKTSWNDHHDLIEIYTCADCKKECEVEEVCADCLGEGEYSTDESDGEGHIMRGVGTQKCHCSIEEEEYDDQE